MSDEQNTQDETQVEEAPVENTIPAPADLEVVAQEEKTVGDEALEVRKPDNSVLVEQVPAQVAPEREAPSAQVNVHETVVTTDTAITDPSSPLAVQVPDAGRGSLALPIHSLGGPLVEDVFAAADKAAADDDS